MMLPNSGRIVIVDDQEDEVKPLMESLGNSSIPYLYYRGDDESRPSELLVGIRLVFLDIELDGMQGQSKENKASNVVRVLKSILSDNNGPYVIVFWTKHKDEIQSVKEKCDGLSIAPIAYLDLEKYTYLKDDNYDLEQINEHLESELKTIPAYQLYLEWENIVNDSSKELVQNMYSIFEDGDDWNKNTNILFYRLYKAYAERNETDDDLLKYKYASFLLNRSFMDVLDKNTNNNLRLPEGFTFAAEVLDKEISAKINTTLHLSEDVYLNNPVGSVYERDDEKLKLSLINNSFKVDKFPKPEDAKLIKIVITPECDIAQNKLLKIEDSDGKYTIGIHRTISGILYLEKPDIKLDNHEGLYKSFRNLWYDNEIWSIVLNLSTIEYYSEEDLEDDAIFRLKKDLLSDLQVSASRHVNRLGINLL